MDMTTLGIYGQATMVFWLTCLTTLALLSMALLALMATVAGILERNS